MHPGCPIEQVYLYSEPIDFRKSINALGVLVEQELGLSPFARALYVFTNCPAGRDAGHSRRSSPRSPARSATRNSASNRAPT